MSSSLRRGTLAATALALAVAGLTACGAGNEAATSQIKPDNAAKTFKELKLQNVNIVTASNDTTETRTEGPATVTARIFNDGPKDEILESITVDGPGGKAKLSPAKGEKELKVPAGGSLKLGGKDEAAALFADAGKAGVLDGNAQSVTFRLSETGPVKMRATVVASAHQYEDIGPTVKPSASASAAEDGGKPEESASHGEQASPSEAAGGEEGAQAGH